VKSSLLLVIGFAALIWYLRRSKTGDAGGVVPVAGIRG